MEGIENNIVSYLKKCGRGRAFFVADFARYGDSRAINKALERMVLSGVLMRVARGIYYYPKIDKTLGLGVLLPSLETIANAIAKRDRAKIVPTGIFALNRLGLSTQVPMKIVYLTNGSPRKINIGNGQTIQFVRTSPKNLAYQNELLMLIVLALKELGQSNVTDEQIVHIKKLLENLPKERAAVDLALMPAWIKDVIVNCYE